MDRREPFLGGGEAPPSPPPLVIEATSIPNLDTQLESGRVLCARPAGFLPDGSIMGTGGDYGPNTGPIDVYSISPAGVVTTHFEDFDTEQIMWWRTFADGTVWTAAVDPHLNGVAELATNRGGWRTIPVQPPGVGNAIHLFDVDEVATGVIGTCGSRGPDTAMVWESNDGGDTWAEVLAHDQPYEGFQRFYGFQRDTAGRAVVLRADGALGYWTRGGDGAWMYADGQPELQQPDLVLTGFGSTNTELRDDAGNFLALLPGIPWRWTASRAPDGSVWLSDRTALYRIPSSER